MIARISLYSRFSVLYSQIILNQKKKTIMKYVNRFLIATAFLSMMSLQSCYFDFDDGDGGNRNFSRCEEGFGNTTTEELVLGDFTGIQLSTDAQVYLTQGEEQEILVKGQRNIIDELDTSVRSGIWEVEFDDCVENSDVLRIYITTPTLEYISNNGSGKIRSEDIWRVEELEIDNNGSGSIILSVEADQINGRNSGSGKVELEGVTQTLDYEVDGSGSVEAFDLLVRDAQLKIDGSGNFQVNVSDFLGVDIRGSGDVYYKGSPDMKVSTNGSGKVFDAN